MAFDPYCRLYLQTDVDRSVLVQRVADSLGSPAVRYSVENSILSLDIAENGDFNETLFASEKRFVFSRYTSEIDGVDPDIDETVFVNCVCDLIVDLRESGVLVAASCDFEDAIAEKTGWNWRANDREQPAIYGDTQNDV